MIGQDTIERVRQQTGIVALVGETVKLQKRGRSHVGLCPFHKEKTPSFHVNEERGFYHCFGCGAHGDAFRFVMEVEGLAFVEAIRRLAERAGIQVVETANDAERKQHAEARRRQDELYAVGSAAAEFYERMLREHPSDVTRSASSSDEACAPRIPTSPIADALQAFRVGYAPYGWDALVEASARCAACRHHAAEQVGLLVPRKTGSGHYDRFRHRLMFAVLDLQGRVIAFSGRALDDPSDEELRVSGIERAGTSTDAPAKYVNSPESPIYEKREAVFGLYQARQSVRDSSQCILVEGNFDVLSLHARGIKNVVAPLGTAFTLEQAQTNQTLLSERDPALRCGRRGSPRRRRSARGRAETQGSSPRSRRFPPERIPTISCASTAPKRSSVCSRPARAHRAPDRGRARQQLRGGRRPDAAPRKSGRWPRCSPPRTTPPSGPGPSNTPNRVAARLSLQLSDADPSV